MATACSLAPQPAASLGAPLIAPENFSPAPQNSPRQRRRLPAPVRLFLTVLLLAPCLLGLARPAAADSWHHGVLQGAEWVDLNHLGIHTHQNKIGFLIKRLYMRNPRNITVTPHCQLSTWVPQWGSIEHWTVEIQGDYAVVTAPSRFADLIVLRATGAAYYQNWPYYADVSWYGP